MFVRATGNQWAYYVDAGHQSITMWKLVDGVWVEKQVMNTSPKDVIDFLINTSRNIVAGTWEEIKA